jgi:signal transduction histidine kinase
MLALGVIALLAIMGQIAVQIVLRNDETNARIVNIAGRQRMLSQKLCKLAAQMSFMEQTPTSAAKEDFLASLLLWRQSHAALQYGDVALKISEGKISDSVKAMFVRLAPTFLSMDAHCQKILSLASDTAQRPLMQHEATLLFRYSNEFLPQMNAIVFRYDEEFRASVRRLEILEGLLFGITLLVLFLEAALVFRPAVKHLRASVEAIEATNKELRHSNDILVRQQAVLEDQAVELEAINVKSQEQYLELERYKTTLEQQNRELEQHRSALQEQMFETERMYNEVRLARRAQSEFLANLSHEVRTPLAAVIGFTEIILADFITEEGKVFGNRVLQSANMLLLLMNDLIDFAQIEAGRFEIHGELQPIRPVIEELSALIGADARVKGLQMNVEIAPEVPKLLIFDAARVRQICFNLLSNAVKFTEKGRVDFRISFNAATGMMRFEVEDTGIGIPNEDLDRVFEPFIQQDGSQTRKYGGVGVGLALVQRIVRLKGGTVTLTSELGKRTLVVVELPQETPKESEE